MIKLYLFKNKTGPRFNKLVAFNSESKKWKEK